MKYKGEAPQKRIERLSIPEPNSGCWLWLGGVFVNSCGKQYGCVSVTQAGKKSARAHRYSFEAHVGPVPDKMFVCHRCDNTLCVNPEHLFLGTNQDNVDDRERKLRNSHTKLTAGKVRSIRERYNAGGVLMRELAAEFGVSRSVISTAINRKSYSFVS